MGTTSPRACSCPLRTPFLAKKTHLTILVRVRALQLSVCRHLALQISTATGRKDPTAVLEALLKLLHFIRFSEHVEVEADEILGSGTLAAIIDTLHLVSGLLTSGCSTTETPWCRVWTASTELKAPQGQLSIDCSNALTYLTYRQCGTTAGTTRAQQARSWASRRRSWWSICQ